MSSAGVTPPMIALFTILVTVLFAAFLSTEILRMYPRYPAWVGWTIIIFLGIVLFFLHDPSLVEKVISYFPIFRDNLERIFFYISITIAVAIFIFLAIRLGLRIARRERLRDEQLKEIPKLREEIHRLRVRYEIEKRSTDRIIHIGPRGPQG